MDAFETARKAALKVNAGVTKYRHASVILDSKGRVIAVGRNHWAGKTIYLPQEDTWIKKTIHSEIDSLSKVNIRRLDDAVLINIAATKVRTILARPCSNCYIVLKKLGFRKMFFSLESDLRKPIWQEETF